MSYDLYYRLPSCPTCGQEIPPSTDDNLERSMNPTFNVSGLFHASLEGVGQPGGIRSLHGKTGAEYAPIVQKALDWMHDPANDEAIRALEPENGWGDRGTLDFVYGRMLRWAEAWPTGMFDSEYGKGIPASHGGKP